MSSTKYTHAFVTLVVFTYILNVEKICNLATSAGTVDQRQQVLRNANRGWKCLEENYAKHSEHDKTYSSSEREIIVKLWKEWNTINQIVNVIGCWRNKVSKAFHKTSKLRKGKESGERLQGTICWWGTYPKTTHFKYHQIGK